ncbi:MAG TPA: tetratricopeptide repeat protein, partial [Opitutaceae bacterium]|nr:tetratricopeptide repeat protein [Opitutaceae bacterium]
SALSLCAVFLSLGSTRANEPSAPLEAPHVPPVLAAGETPGKSEAEKPVVSPPAEGTVAKSAVEIRGLLNLGASLTDRKDYDAAEIAFRQVMNANEVTVTDIQSALLGLARMHRLQGSLTKAAAIYEKFLKDYPGDTRCPEALLDLGRTLRSMGAYKRAIGRFYGVINATLKLPGEGFERYQVLAKTAQFEIAETHFQAGDFADAAKFFARLRLLDLAPADRANAHFKSAYALQLQGDHEGALTNLRAYLSQWPDDENVPEARYLLAVTLRTLNRREEAFSVALDLLRAEKSQLASNPKRWIYWQRRTGNQLANDFFENGEIFNAQTIYNGMVALSDDPSWRLPITYQIGLCHERLGNLDQARTSYQSIIDSAGANAPVHLAEIARMAGWHLEHLNWREKFGQKVTNVFETTTGSRHIAEAPQKSAALQ